MKTETKRVSALIAGAVLALAGLSATAMPAQAADSGPTNCTTSVANNAFAWPTAYGVCHSGSKYRTLGYFRNLANDSYTAYGPCVSTGKTSAAKAMGLFDKAVSAVIKRC